MCCHLATEWRFIMDKRLHRDVYVSVGMLIFCIAFINIAARLPAGARNLPLAMLIFMTLMSLLILYDGVKKTRLADGNRPIQNGTELQDCIKPLLVFLFVVGYTVLFKVLGFFAATPVFLIALFRYLDAGSWKRILMITLGYTVVIYVVFAVFLGVPLHRIGLLGGLFRFG